MVEAVGRLILRLEIKWLQPWGEQVNRDEKQVEPDFISTVFREQGILISPKNLLQYKGDPPKIELSSAGWAPCSTDFPQ